MKPPAPVAILGAGLTGMSAAFHLRRAGVPCRLFEALDHPGGHVVTIEDNGFRFDRTGHLLHLRDPEMRALALDWIGEDHLVVTRNSAIWSNGVYTRYPFQANTLGLPPSVAYECLLGFIRAKLEPAREEPRDFEQFCLAHFGEGFSRHFMIPYNCRLWGVHPREITAAWCSRFVPIPSVEDVVAGAVGLTDRAIGYNAEFVYPRLGIGELARGLASRVEPVELGMPVSAIEPRERCITFADGSTVSYRVLVSTAPLDRLCAMLHEPPETVRAAAARLRCNGLWYLDVALERPSGTPYHWVYVPEERYPFYRVGCYSHFSPALAPAGKASLYVELVDRAEPDLGTLLPRVAEHLVEMRVIASARDIAFARARKMDYAYVVFDHDYYASVSTTQQYLGEHAIVSTGRYGGWNYSSMEDALLFGRDAARRAVDLMR
jgi:YD repeat-containing protein